ncbi:endostatin-like outer membrane lipoprotein LenC [Leptospira alstonii]|uniref:PF07588 family protein n=2 Tax=Leptospira alstonii TaxID=28452 RepID=M6CGA1_9LEPT|nr:DUF1554 domain-containing protein [Leptospira alstonii]EMJ90769.1 PF07588 family protein [Leptospira alstonii serovar Sichuan str. 79601]EQA78577.1 PF07588 family protein [Leptospira alstonii serovar Pingchang str. 80-412]
MKIKYKFAVVSVFTLIFVACFNKSSGGDNSVLSGLLAIISDKQTLGSATLSGNQLRGQNLQSAFPEGYAPYIFTTSSSGAEHNGNFGGISGADAYCQSHIPSNIPTGIYKAMIVDGVNRVATIVGPNSTVGQKDWVFQPNQQYRRAEDGANVMFTNSSGMIDFQSGKRLENPFTQVKESGQWTGLNSNWVLWTSGGIPGREPIICDSWTSSDNSVYGVYGISVSMDSNILRGESTGSFVTSCSNTLTSYQNYRLGLVCVEQPRPKYIFVTSSTEEWHNGNFGGIAGADAYCQSQVPTNLPSGGTYKAMIVDGVNRVATTVGPNSTVGQKDWVLLPNQKYIRDYDDTFIMTTNSSGMFDFANNRKLENSFSQIAAAHWTGLNSDWTVWTSGGIPGLEPIICDSWTSSDNSVYGVYGMSNSTDSNALKAESNGTFTTSCSNKLTSYGNYRLGLVCVEQ